MNLSSEKSRVMVTGAAGLVGSAIVRQLEQNTSAEVLAVTRNECDLMDQNHTRAYIDETSPDAIVIAAAKVGGIVANSTYPAEFIYNNLMIAANIIEAAHRSGVKKLLFLGSSCIYPKLAPQPMKEEHLLTGPLEPTNEWYAVAKIAGIKLCEAYRRQYNCDFISAMPTNLYGPGDNYHPQNSHVLPALIRRFHEAKVAQFESVKCWGDGSPLREFLHVDDLARACVFLLEHYSEGQFINVGSGSEITIKELSETVASVVGYEGTIEWDTTKPNGTPRKLMDSSRLLGLGWKPVVPLREGIAGAYQDFQRRYVDVPEKETVA